MYVSNRLRIRDNAKAKAAGGARMSPEEKIIAHVRSVLAEKPDVATPDQKFLRDWAYGNAGLEDERITIEQVESVMASTGRKSA